MKRRTFISQLALGAGAVVCAPLLPVAPTPLVFNPLGPIPLKMLDRELGISIRFIRKWDIQRDLAVSRLDLRWFVPTLPNGAAE